MFLLGCVAQAWCDEWEEDDEVVVEDDVPADPVDPAAEARANHAKMHGAPAWASDPEVLVRAKSSTAFYIRGFVDVVGAFCSQAVMEEPRVKELLETMTSREGAEAASK